jgi:hypothetical protein
VVIYIKMQHLQTFTLFESQLPINLTQEQITFLNRHTRGRWLVNPTTGLVDIQGDFSCDKYLFENLLGIKFGEVKGDFFCSQNILTSLEGAPEKVEGDFFCYTNNLISLVGAPQTVGGDFDCYNDHLISLEGAPQTVRGDFMCNYNRLTSLIGAPQTVGGNFLCDYNRLTSLTGAPQTLKGVFHCDAFRLAPGQWNPKGWIQVLKEGDPAARRLILTLPAFDAQFWLGRLKGDLKQDGQTLLQLADLWGREDWEEVQARLQQELDPGQLRVIQALRTKLDYVDPWQDFRL